MKVYLIRKFESNMANMFTYFKIWKITNDYDLANFEIRKDVLDENEKLNIEYSTDSTRLITITKVKPTNRDLGTKEWPLFTYVVSEMEVITE